MSLYSFHKIIWSCTEQCYISLILMRFYIYLTITSNIKELSFFEWMNLLGLLYEYLKLIHFQFTYTCKLKITSLYLTSLY